MQTIGEKLRLTDQRWAVKGYGDVLKKIEDREALQGYKDNKFSTVQRTKIGARFELVFRRFFSDQRV